MKRSVLAVAICVAAQGSSPPISLTFINELTILNNQLATQKDTDWKLRPWQHSEKFSILGNTGMWSAGLVLRDVNFFAQQPQETLPESEQGTHRFFMKYSGHRLQLQGGDFYAQMGRGLVLSLVQNDKTMRERTIRGLDASGQLGSLELRVLGGRVRTETGEQTWDVRAAEASMELFSGHRLGVRSSVVDDVKTFLRLGKRETRSASLGANNLWGCLDYYAESATLWFDRPERKDGAADYRSLTFHRNGWMFQAEHKRYKHFENEVNNPPLADRQDEMNNLHDSEGTRLFAQRSWLDSSVTVFASGGNYREGFFKGSQWYAGFNLDDFINDRLSISFQYGKRHLLFPTIKTDGSFTWRFDPRWSLQATYKEKRYDTGSSRFKERDGALTVARAAWGSAFLNWQYTLEKVMQLNHLWSGGFRVELKKGSFLELSGGRLRGGEICSGGQCAFLPPFKGWKAASMIRF